MDCHTFITQYTSRYALPRTEVELIVAQVLNIRRESLLAHPETTIAQPLQHRCRQLLKRRSLGEPIPYLINQQAFFGLDFFVDRRVLIPRPETELIVEMALQIIQPMTDIPTAVIDVGTGSGCIITSLYTVASKKCSPQTLEHFQWYALDRSKPALTVAKKNVARHAPGRIRFAHSDLLTVLLQRSALRIQLRNARRLIILANLPYLSTHLFRTAPISVREFEPEQALHSGLQGTDHYSRLFGQLTVLHTFLPHHPITLILECSPEQKNVLSQIAHRFFAQAPIHWTKDLAGKWRIMQVSLK